MKNVTKATSATAILAAAAFAGLTAGTLQAQATGGNTLKATASSHAGIVAMDDNAGSKGGDKSSCSGCNAPAPKK